MTAAFESEDRMALVALSGRCTAANPPPPPGGLFEDDPGLVANLWAEHGHEGIGQCLDQSWLGLGVQTPFVELGCD
jgi:hypothetical protein